MHWTVSLTGGKETAASIAALLAGHGGIFSLDVAL